MSIKIKGYLFTGPFPVEKTNRRANQAETVFAVVRKGGSAWDPVFELLDLGRTGSTGMAFADHPHAAAWRGGDGTLASIYLLDTTTQPEAAADLDKVVGDILAAHTLPAALK
ncbi:hypothetical protein [Dongia sedimenti]|uniref:Uncharacterized protein n=1 Tax=Dongia sedimenti TaxID=3064282 RepID=A0ABU0YKU7_9PROT|nr:hypothetical protein [Rhodospirillaceae bacterium R-7]